MPSSCAIIALPNSLLEYIQSFLCYRPINPFVTLDNFYKDDCSTWKGARETKDIRMIETERDWRNLMNTCQEFQALKKITIFLMLVGDYTDLYLADSVDGEVFRCRVDGLLEDRGKQLGFVNNIHPIGCKQHWDGCNTVLSERYGKIEDEDEDTDDEVYYQDNYEPVAITPIHVKSLNFWRISPSPLIFDNRYDNLITLSLCFCYVTSIEGLPSLTHLYLQKVFELESIYNLPALKVLKISYCLDFDVSCVELSILQSLEHFALTTTNFTEEPAELITTVMKDLPSLSLQWDDFNNEKYSSFHSLQHLQVLCLNLCRLTDESCFPVNLIKLMLYECTFSDELSGQWSFTRFARLERLIIREWNPGLTKNSRLRELIYCSSHPLKYLEIQKCEQLSLLTVSSKVKRIHLIDQNDSNLKLMVPEGTIVQRLSND